MSISCRGHDSAKAHLKDGGGVRDAGGGEAPFTGWVGG
jgi:hypothetical protein